MSEFAFGRDEVDDCLCPAAQAGLAPGEGDVSTEVANEYDRRVRDRVDDIKGVIDESVAREAWFEAIEKVESAYNDSQFAEAGERVAEELGWTSDDG